MIKKLVYLRKSVFLSLVISIVGCGDDGSVNIQDLIEIDSNIDVNLDKALILSIVNDHRLNGTDCNSAKDEVITLTWSDELAKAALDHSNDMQRNGYFDHTGLNGSRFSERAEAAGYTGNPLGENIASGYGTEEAVMEGWMQSNGHCNNIMNGNANEIGIARSDEGALWTMILGRQQK